MSTEAEPRHRWGHRSLPTDTSRPIASVPDMCSGRRAVSEDRDLVSRPFVTGHQASTAWNNSEILSERPFATRSMLTRLTLRVPRSMSDR